MFVMISIKSDREIELMRIAGKYLSDTFKYIEKYIETGVTTKRLDTLIHDYIISIDCVPSCLGYEGYPATACISINDEVVHGIPKGRKIKNGDIVSIDLVLSYKGYHADATRTYIIGNVSDEVRNLVNDTKGAFYAGVKKFLANVYAHNIFIQEIPFTLIDMRATMFSEGLIISDTSSDHISIFV